MRTQKEIREKIKELEANPKGFNPALVIALRWVLAGKTNKKANNQRR